MFLVYRYGSNAANQSMTPKMPLCFVDTDNEMTAERIAEVKFTFYNNQTMEVCSESEVDNDEWNELAGEIPCYLPAEEKIKPIATETV
jgi:hypothetical protein